MGSPRAPPGPWASVPRAALLLSLGTCTQDPELGLSTGEGWVWKAPLCPRTGWSPGSVEERELAPRRRRGGPSRHTSAWSEECRGGQCGPSMSAKGGQRRGARQGGG